MKKVFALIAGMMMFAGAGMSVQADEVQMADKNTIKEEIWEDVWQGRGDNGIIFPEASFKRHILEKWVDDNYGDDDYNWTDVSKLKYSYTDYYRDLVDKWDFEDDEDGNWTITTPEHRYRFELVSGKWNMIDENGDTVDMFMPFSTLEEDTEPGKTGSVQGDGENSPRVIGEVAGNSETVAVTMASTPEISSGSSNIIIPVAAIVIMAAAGVFIICRKKK